MFTPLGSDPPGDNFEMLVPRNGAHKIIKVFCCSTHPLIILIMLLPRDAKTLQNPRKMTYFAIFEHPDDSQNTVKLWEIVKSDKIADLRPLQKQCKTNGKRALFEKVSSGKLCGPLRSRGRLKK